MDIRTKLIFALVGVSLVSMLALGAFTYDTAEEMLRESALGRLEGLAETKKQDLARVVVAWRDRVELVASRTQLRLSLREFTKKGDPAELRRIERILNDARRSVPAVRGLGVFDMEGRRVASVGEETALFEAPEMRTTIYDVPAEHESRPLHVDLFSPMRLDGEVIGSLRARLDAGEVMAVAAETTGLGRSGEILIVSATEDGQALVINLPDDAGDPITVGDGRDPVRRAAQGEEALFLEGTVDYRAEPVWAATRYLPEPGWGIVVKMDEAELLEPVGRLAQTIWKLSVSLSAFGIVAGTLLGLYFARPIRRLADVAGRIADGDLTLRAETDSEDEVGQLALAFNRMAGKLIETNRGLQEKLDGRTGA